MEPIIWSQSIILRIAGALKPGLILMVQLIRQFSPVDVLSYCLMGSPASTCWVAGSEGICSRANALLVSRPELEWQLASWDVCNCSSVRLCKSSCTHFLKLCQGVICDCFYLFVRGRKDMLHGHSNSERQNSVITFLWTDWLTVVFPFRKSQWDSSMLLSRCGVSTQEVKKWEV